MDYVFTFEDYCAYTQHCAASPMSSSLSRAALMKGGYIWRVSVPILSVQKVIDGPSGVVNQSRRDVCGVVNGDGRVCR